MEYKFVRVCFTYHMHNKQWEIAENCLTTSMEESAYNELAKELESDCWSMSLQSEPGKEVIKTLKALAKLQGYKKLDSWTVELVR